VLNHADLSLNRSASAAKRELPPASAPAAGAAGTPAPGPEVGPATSAATEFAPQHAAGGAAAAAAAAASPEAQPLANGALPPADDAVAVDAEWAAAVRQVVAEATESGPEPVEAAPSLEALHHSASEPAEVSPPSPTEADAPLHCPTQPPLLPPAAGEAQSPIDV